jgi:hypothetical protein
MTGAPSLAVAQCQLNIKTCNPVCVIACTASCICLRPSQIEQICDLSWDTPGAIACGASLTHAYGHKAWRIYLFTYLTYPVPCRITWLGGEEAFPSWVVGAKEAFYYGNSKCQHTSMQTATGTDIFSIITTLRRALLSMRICCLLHAAGPMPAEEFYAALGIVAEIPPYRARGDLGDLSWVREVAPEQDSNNSAT